MRYRDSKGEVPFPKTFVQVQVQVRTGSLHALRRGARAAGSAIARSGCLRIRRGEASRREHG